MRNYFRSRKVVIDEKGPGRLLLSVYNPALANRINKALRTYDDVHIKEGEEPMFTVDLANYRKIERYLALPMLVVERIENFFKLKV